MKPDLSVEMSTTQYESFRSNTFQVWQKNGRCPKGTIPIRRVREQDLLRTSSLDHFGKKFSYGGSKLGSEVNRSVSNKMSQLINLCVLQYNNIVYI